MKPLRGVASAQLLRGSWLRSEARPVTRHPVLLPAWCEAPAFSSPPPSPGPSAPLCPLQKSALDSGWRGQALPPSMFSSAPRAEPELVDRPSELWGTQFEKQESVAGFRLRMPCRLHCWGCGNSRRAAKRWSPGGPETATRPEKMEGILAGGLA